VVTFVTVGDLSIHLQIAAVDDLRPYQCKGRASRFNVVLHHKEADSGEMGEYWTGWLAPN